MMNRLLAEWDVLKPPTLTPAERHPNEQRYKPKRATQKCGTVALGCDRWNGLARPFHRCQSQIPSNPNHPLAKKSL